MRNKTLRLVGLNLSLVLLFLSITIVVGPSLRTLYCCPSPDPVVDGTIGASEWKEGVPKEVKLHNLLTESDIITVEIQSVHGNDLILYFGITFEDNGINPEDYFFIVFKNVEGDPLVLPPYNASGTFGLEHDVKMLWLHNNVSIDAFTKDSGYIWEDDIIAGGTYDLTAKCYFNGTHTTIEMRSPFNSGDTAGHDFSLSVGVRMQIMLWYHDEDKHIDFCQILETTLDYEWLDLYIGCTPTPIPITFVILGLATTVAVSLIMKRRRK
jgi:hypothetical protein